MFAIYHVHIRIRKTECLDNYDSILQQDDKRSFDEPLVTIYSFCIGFFLYNFISHRYFWRCHNHDFFFSLLSVILRNCSRMEFENKIAATGQNPCEKSINFWSIRDKRLLRTLYTVTCSRYLLYNCSTYTRHVVLQTTYRNAAVRLPSFYPYTHDVINISYHCLISRIFHELSVKKL